MAAIDVRGVSKRFGSTIALDQLDLTVEAGQVHGFLGPNGAGKTTLLRILLGLVHRDQGEISVLGVEPWGDAVKLHRRLAYVPGDVTLWPNLTGGETLDLLSRLHGGFDPHRLDELVGWFELDTSRKARSYSKGNRQKVVLIAALASEAELLLLDEPTSGLDPLMEEVFRRCLEVERNRGRTVLLSSHLLAEVERLCGYVTIIRNGRAVESGSLDQLRHLSSTTVTAEISGTSDDLVKIDGVHDLVIIDGTLTCRVDDEHYGELLHRLSSLGVRRLEAHPPTLEEIFLRFYSDQEMPRP